MSDPGTQLTVGELVYKLSGDMSDLQVTLKNAQTEIGKLKGAMEKSTATSEKQAKGFSAISTALKGFIGLIAFDKLKGFLEDAVGLAQQRLELETALAQQLRISQNATDDQIASLNEQAKALEKVGVVDADTITALQSRLSGFDLSVDSIKALTPAILDYTVAEKGANATREDAESRANGLAQAINGNFKSLTSVGFVLDDTTKKMISQGTEAERVAAIVKVLESTYQGVNETMGKSFVGNLKHAKEALDDVKTTIGLSLLPAIGVLGDEIVGTTGDFTDNAETVNSLGKIFYRLANILVVVAETFKVLAKGAQVAFEVVQAGALGVVKSITDLQIKIGELTGKNVDDLKTFSQGIQVEINDLSKSVVKNGDDIIDSSNTMAHAMQQALDPTDYKDATAADIAALDAQRQAQNALGDSAEDTENKLKKFTDGIAAAGTQSVKTRQDIQDDLTKSVTDFGKSLTDTFQETSQGLAKITVDAQAKLKDLKKQLSDTTDADQQKDIRTQIKEQQSIIDSSKDYAKRQADEITKIRTKLTTAGIDLASSGLDAILKTGDFQKELDEQRRQSQLNDFQLFEEQQNKKLEDLTDAFVTEVTLLKTKYDTQKQLESDITAFLETENAKRLDSTEAWADATVEKYKEVADSIKNLLPDTTVLSKYAGVGTLSQFSPAATVAATPGASSTTTNSTNTTINAPVTINGKPVENLSAKELSAILGFELNKFTR